MKALNWKLFPKTEGLCCDDYLYIWVDMGNMVKNGFFFLKTYIKGEFMQGEFMHGR